MKDGFYFILKLTENEHFAVEEMLFEYCKKIDCTMKYYRKLKTGHVPMLREVKVLGDRKQISLLKRFMENNYLLLENYWENVKREKRDRMSRYTEDELKMYKQKYPFLNDIKF